MDSDPPSGLQPLALLLASASALAGTVYLEPLKTYVQLLGQPGQTYLTLTLVAIIVVMALEAGRLKSIPRPGPERLLASLALLSMSTLLYALSKLPGHGVELAVFSLVTGLWGLALVILDSDNRRTLALLLASLALLIPLPEATAGWLASITVPRLAAVCSYLTGAPLGRVAGRGLVLEVPGASIPASLALGGASSILTAVPALLLLGYAALKTPGAWGRKARYLAAGVAATVAAATAASLAEGVLVVLVARASPDAAYTLAHGLPPLLYGAAVAAGLYAYLRLSGTGFTRPSWAEPRGPWHPERVPPLAALLLLALATAHVATANILAPSLLANEGAPGGVVYLDELVGNTSVVLFNSTGVKPVHEAPATREPASGSSMVKEIEIEVQGYRYRGLAEVADSPEDLMDLDEYLRLKGYILTNETELVLGNSLIRTITIRSGSGEALVVLTATYRVPVYVGGRETTTYVRLTLTTEPGRTAALLDTYKELAEKWGAEEPSQRRISLWAAATTILSLGVLVYAAGKTATRRTPLGGGRQ